MKHASVQKKLIIAHRGLSGSFPENTLLAFEAALKTTADFIELDTRLTKDDVPVVIHDDDLERTTGVKGGVRQTLWKDIRDLSAGYPQEFGDKYPQARIPKLIDAVRLVMTRSDKSLFIEIKHLDKDMWYNLRVGRIVYDTVMKEFSQYKERFAFISFALPILAMIRKADPAVHLAPIFNEHPRFGSLADQALKLNADRVIFSKKLLLRKPDVIQKRGKTAHVQHFIYTVLPSEFKRFGEVKDLDGFATNDADQIP